MAKSKLGFLPWDFMNRVSIKLIAVALAALGMTSAAFGQYAWIDEKGVRQYSDMPPPVSVPKNRILKQPSGGAPADADATSAPPAAQPKTPSTLADRNAEFQKRRAEQAEKEKKAAEEAKQVADKARNCERARSYQRTLASGERIATTDKNGERSFMTDEQRSRELGELKEILDSCK